MMTLSDEAVAALARALGIDAQEIARRKAFLEFGADDVQLLKALHEHLRGAERRFVDEFYAHLLKFDETRRFIPDAPSVERLKHSQAAYFESLTAGDYGPDYILDRLRVGIVHQRIGLEPKWYIGTYSKYLGGLLPELWRLLGDDPDRFLSTFRALQKIVLLDMGLALDTYIQTEGREALRESENRFRVMFERTADALLLLDPGSGQFIDYNQAATDMLRCTDKKEILLLHPAQLSPLHQPDGRRSAEKADEMIATALRNGSHRFEWIHCSDHREDFLVEVLLTPILLGERQLIITTWRDITERRQAENLLARLGRILDSSSNEIYVFDAETLRFAQVNQGAQRNLGYSLEELQELTALDIKPDLNRESFEAMIAPLRAGEQEVVSFVTHHRRKDGSIYPVEVHLQLSRAESPPVFVAIIQDITERRQAEERLSYLAYHDTLTGLPNRVLLLDRLQQALIEAGRTQRLVAVMFLDLDRFKVINDTLGHAVGDVLLQAVAERLRSCVRPGDTISRLGGDEFTVVLADVAHVDDVARVARKILDSFASPFRVEGRELFTAASLGITLHPLDARDAEGLLKYADAAMYHAKESGRNTFRFFTAELNVRAERRLQLETALRQAVEKNELTLHYQPLLDLESGHVTGTEALARWSHPELGTVSPVEFIPVAEETGLILPIGEWVLREACRQTKVWHETGFPELQVAVNVSGKQLRQKDFPDRVRQALYDTGLEARYLDLEITESMLMEEAPDIMNALHDMGVSFSVDDFGTGYSSLAYLKRFPINVLKIDQSFVRDIASDPNDAAIVKAIIVMAHTLGLRVVAEGVETREQLEFLRDALVRPVPLETMSAETRKQILRGQGCDAMQGYFFSKPLPAEEISRLLQNTWNTDPG